MFCLCCFKENKNLPASYVKDPRFGFMNVSTPELRNVLEFLRTWATYQDLGMEPSLHGRVRENIMSRVIHAVRLVSAQGS